MNDTICTACQSKSISKQNFAVSGIYDLMLCEDCGLKFIQSSTGGELPIDDYWDDINKEVYQRNTVIQEMEDKYGKYLEKTNSLAPPNNSLLDVGSGAGIFLNIASKNGFNANGVEPSECAVEICKSQYHIEASCGLLDIDDSLPKDYGVLTAWDVIEHVVDPLYFAKACHQHIAPNGIFLLETPNEGCLLRKIINLVSVVSGRKIDLRPKIYYHHHRFYFTKNAITKLLHRAGFKDVSIYDDRTMYEKELSKIELYEKPSSSSLKLQKLLFKLIAYLPFTKNKQIVVCRKAV